MTEKKNNIQRNAGRGDICFECQSAKSLLRSEIEEHGRIEGPEAAKTLRVHHNRTERGRRFAMRRNLDAVTGRAAN